MISIESINNLFSSTVNSQDQYDNLANSALSRGIDLYTNGDYGGAAQEFKRSVGLSPFSDNSGQAYEYLAITYLKQNNIPEAIKTYKQMVKADPSNDGPHLSLGNIYFKAGQYKEAEAEYSMAVKINPASAANRYALGQTYSVTGRYNEAENQFTRVTQITPLDPNGYDALGQAMRSQGRNTDAEVQFKKAISLDRKYADGYLSLGFVYIDLDMPDKANQQLDILSTLDQQKASDLKDYIAKAADPKFKLVYSTSGYPLSAGRNTRVSTIDRSLAVPNASKNFTLTFMFDKEMDPYSVQNPSNWLIGRAPSGNPGGPYNLGLPIPSTEVLPPSKPSSIKYDQGTHMAEVSFAITQNSLANGTIDPAHIVFRFAGKDAYGKIMDPSADEYSSVSKIV